MVTLIDVLSRIYGAEMYGIHETTDGYVTVLGVGGEELSLPDDATLEAVAQQIEAERSGQ